MDPPLELDDPEFELLLSVYITEPLIRPLPISDGEYSYPSSSDDFEFNSSLPIDPIFPPLFLPLYFLNGFITTLEATSFISRW
jgi:hypothetical protein